MSFIPINGNGLSNSSSEGDQTNTGQGNQNQLGLQNFEYNPVSRYFSQGGRIDGATSGNITPTNGNYNNGATLMVGSLTNISCLTSPDAGNTTTTYPLNYQLTGSRVQATNGTGFYNYWLTGSTRPNIACVMDWAGQTQNSALSPPGGLFVPILQVNAPLDVDTTKTITFDITWGCSAMDINECFWSVRDAPQGAPLPAVGGGLCEFAVYNITTSGAIQYNTGQSATQSYTLDSTKYTLIPGQPLFLTAYISYALYYINTPAIWVRMNYTSK
ncbi:hypothetical protein EBZ38_10895 [bacterium]|nr:hypothetical protein [bacterium]NDC95464.1 hypothetical protein [bacterium]NDD84757.1 hypothetical protein [bacterium]